MVGGVPIGDAYYVHESLRSTAAGVVSYIETTVTQLRDSPHALWSALYYCCASRFDYWLRLVPPSFTLEYARSIDAALVQAAEATGYAGFLGDAISLERMSLPARMRGLGLRRREVLAPAAFAASLVEAAQRFLRIGARRGFFDMLQPLFGAGAFDAGGVHLATFTAMPLWRGQLVASELVGAWNLMRAEVAGARGTGPLDVEVAQAGFGRQQTARSEGLQRLITAQREQVRRDDLHRQVMLLHHSDTRRQAWLACDCFSTAFVSSYPSERDALSAREFPEVITHTTWVARARLSAAWRGGTSRARRLASLTHLAVSSAWRLSLIARTPTVTTSYGMPSRMTFFARDCEGRESLRASSRRCCRHATSPRGTSLQGGTCQPLFLTRVCMCGWRRRTRPEPTCISMGHVGRCCRGRTA